METMLDKFGRIVLPKQVRDDLGLKVGEILRVEEREDEIVLKPIQKESHLNIKDGVLVFSASATGDLTQAMSAQREERLHHLKGRLKK